MANTELILWAEELDLYGELDPTLSKIDNWPFLTNTADRGSPSDQKGLLKGKTLKRLGKGLLLQVNDCSSLNKLAGV